MSFLLPRTRYFLCTLLLTYVSLNSAMAAPTPGDQDLIRDRQNRLLEEQRRRLEELQDLPGKGSTPEAPALPADTRCFPIQDIELKGADSLSAADRARLLKPYLGQCLGVAQLNQLLKVITDYYIAKGRVTSRAYLPQQDLSSGHLQVLVVEGKLEGIKGAQGSTVTDRELAMAFPGKVGEALNLREVEQLVDQLSRLPSKQAQMELSPGAQIGGSEVLVRNQPQKPWRASLSRNNDGQKSTGEQQWGAGLEWDSPLGLADQLILRGGHDAISDHQKTSKNSMLYYNVPWGWWNFSYTYSESDYRTPGSVDDFKYKQWGDSQNHQLRAERVVHRDDVSKTSVNVGLTHLRTNNYINDTRLDVSSNRLSEFQVGVSHGRRIGSAFVNLDVGMQNGIGAFDAQKDEQTRIRGNLTPTPRYRKYTATLSYLQPFTLWGESLSFSSLATGQRSEDVLYAPQRMSLGGSYSVRGFKDQQLNGDSGGYWRNEVRWARPVTLDWMRPAFAEYGASVGYDQGVIRNDRYNEDQHGRVSSNSLELFARGKHVSTSVTFAHSLERPGVVTEREAPIYFRLDFYL
ncbi:Hemolysin transporter protein ShlB precursor [Pseudomonas sp. 22 E 5]|jgi:hemolysin activation/secretion protein|uniref:ShlB/FhaC/HecB family hemolysin secretion/activation protein n=1 Tax=Pseudomonas fluorescens TaxID=294 RepID=A0A4Y9T748_PSEFL|nr:MULTISPECIES: ShlB/FhaC/HecB family hemolysin secretion/activation protein [Pseudomonas]CRM94572.1 Hemolysin transporter protein ShlB precursor [Pseudomonas sp. 22 E 5]TFW40265.1 ShlB/FhaC/HecB family hemolysin secretion/activation protein [Pseudomonas fluorescens]TKJ56306.1 ShlB/FhaC/HecB family hemolysin secretion/activation protein [Pseudomonas sp. CFBP13506]CRM06128.1 Hemolysin transporter protein ShlB precursor [Pseudomonas sp. 31 E 6]CRM09105.1 Hemolysin transporter protein ShlB precu